VLLAHRQHERPAGRLAALRVYEAHVGMSSEEPKVASYTYFKGDCFVPICVSSVHFWPLPLLDPPTCLRTTSAHAHG
jgi:hypothetical protein